MSSLLSQSSSLIAFVQVVEAGSFSAAARIAGTTPSAISKGIARLEKKLNVTLFRRSTRTLSLTPDGHLFSSAWRHCCVRWRTPRMRFGPPETCAAICA